MKKIVSICLTFCMVITLIITQTGCAGNEKPVTKTTYLLDTVVKIDIYDMKDMSEETAGDAIADAFKLCSEYESILSKTKEGSDIYRINHAGGKTIKCDPRTIKCIKKGIYYGDLSKGKFDITVGKVTDLWDFHQEEDAKLPSKSALRSALKAVNYKQIQIKGNSVTMTNPDGEIDLGGIAKGYIADRLTEQLEEKGVTSAVINLGGNIEVIGKKGDKDFKIGIEKPYSDQSEIVGSVEVSDATIVTSGIYERFIEVNKKKYHHILDVKTGYPVDTDVVGVSLIAGKGHSVDCDGLSTTCLILGVSDATKLIESIDGVEAVFIDKDDHITKTSGLKNFTQE